MATLVQDNSLGAIQGIAGRDTLSHLNVDKVVQSVTNATKRLSQISTNTNHSANKRQSHNRVGPWKLGRTLGRGSTGRVRLARNSETGQLAAVKILPKSNFRKVDARNKANMGPEYKHKLAYGIEREIIIMKLVSHPNIMGLYDVWENKNDLYLVLEYIEGGELFDYLIKRGQLAEAEAVGYFKQIIGGVSYLHQFNICHRDLKPENLLLDHNNNIKIADFGMAALEVQNKLLETSCGSPHYASPEIVSGKNYHGAPSDIWSCGIILFALLTGHLPFDDENIRKLLLKVQHGKYTMPKFLSPEAKDLISKILRVNPKERISIAEIARHPLFQKYPNQMPDVYRSFEATSLKDPVTKSDKEIDDEVLQSLSILFHNRDKTILVKRLMSNESGSEKLFYYLLREYRKAHKERNGILRNLDSNPPSENQKEEHHKSSLKGKDQTNDQTQQKPDNSIHREKNILSKSESAISKKSSKENRRQETRVFTDVTNTLPAFKASTSFNKRKIMMNKPLTGKSSVKSTKLLPLQKRSLKQNLEMKLKSNNNLKRSSVLFFAQQCDQLFDHTGEDIPTKSGDPIDKAEIEGKEKHSTRITHGDGDPRSDHSAPQSNSVKPSMPEKLNEPRDEINQNSKAQKEANNSHDETKKDPRRNVTEPPFLGSLDPKAAKLKVTARRNMTDLPSPSQSSKVPKTLEQNSKVLNQLGINVAPPKQFSSFSREVRTFNSRNLSHYLKGDQVTRADKPENLSIGKFNNLEKRELSSRTNYGATVKSHPPISKVPQLTELTKAKEPRQYKSSLLDDDNHGKGPENVSVKAGTVTEKKDFERLHKQQTAPLNSDKTSFIPNPRFSRLTFTGLFDSVSSDLDAGDDKNSVKKNLSLKRSKNIILNDLTGPDKQEKSSQKSFGSSATLKGLGLDYKDNSGKDNSDTQGHDTSPDRTATTNEEFTSVKLPSMFAESVLDKSMETDPPEVKDSHLLDTTLDLSRVTDVNHNRNVSEVTGVTDYSNFDTMDTQVAEIGQANKVLPGYVQTSGSSSEALNKLEGAVYGNSNASASSSEKKLKPKSNYAANQSATKDDEHHISEDVTTKATSNPRTNKNESSQYSNASLNGDKVEQSSDKVEQSFDKVEQSSDIPESPKENNEPSKDENIQQNDPDNNPANRSETVVRRPIGQKGRLTMREQNTETPVQKNPPPPERKKKQCILQRFGCISKRPAPKAPRKDLLGPGHVGDEKETQYKENNVEPSPWFLKFVRILMLKNNGSETTLHPNKVEILEKDMFFLDTYLSFSQVNRALVNTLELKKVEGSVSKVEINEEVGLIHGVIPAKFAGGRQLHFKIAIIGQQDSSTVQVSKTKGTTKEFKNLTKVVKYIIHREENSSKY